MTSEAPFINGETGSSLIDRMLGDERHAGKLDDGSLDAFEDMRERELPLSAKQLLWIQRKAIQLGILDEPATNEWSRRTPAEQERIRGREVPTPAVLQNKPLLPPHRLAALVKAPK